MLLGAKQRPRLRPVGRERSKPPVLCTRALKESRRLEMMDFFLNLNYILRLPCVFLKVIISALITFIMGVRFVWNVSTVLLLSTKGKRNDQMIRHMFYDYNNMTTHL